MINPFVYSQPVSSEALLDRDSESRLLLDRALGGHNSRVVAPRRYGKTSLLRRVLADVENEGLTGVYVSFFGVLTPADIAQRVERAYSEQLTGRLAAWFSGLRRSLRPSVGAHAGVPGVGGQFSVAVEPPEQSLLDRLALPRRLYEHKGSRTIVVFDEFQDVLSAGQRMDAVIRSEIEHHGDAASYIFAGSHVGMMRELFASKRRAFYGQAGPVELGPLAGPDIAEELNARFEAGGRQLRGALDLLLDVAQGHPQRTMLLAHFLWELSARGTLVDEAVFARALDHVLDVEVSDELRAIWSNLPDTQRRVLAAVADNAAGLYSAATRERFGGGRGGYIKQAVKALVDAGELVADETSPTRYRLVDPLLALWIRDRRAHAG